MPGYDTNRFVDLTQSEKSELICSICQDILRCPVVTHCCLQSFCDDCINDWINTNNTCPYDRKSLTSDQLSRAPRAMMNMLGKLRIRCDFRDNGCDEVIVLEDLSNHLQKCRFANKECEKCFCRNSKANHDCVEYLLDTNNQMAIEANQLRESNVQFLDTNNKITAELNAIKLINAELLANKRNTTTELNQIKRDNEELIKKVDTTMRSATNSDESIANFLHQIDELKKEKETSLLTIDELKNEIQSIPSFLRQIFKIDNTAKVRVMFVNMSAEMKQYAINTALRASRAYNIKKQHKEVAGYLAKEFDSKYGRSWQCVVGTDFGNCLSYTTYISFSLNNVALLLFKTR